MGDVGGENSPTTKYLFYYDGTAIVSEYGTGGVVGFEDATDEGGIP